MRAHYSGDAAGVIHDRGARVGEGGPRKFTAVGQVMDDIEGNRVEFRGFVPKTDAMDGQSHPLGPWDSRGRKWGERLPYGFFAGAAGGIEEPRGSWGLERPGRGGGGGGHAGCRTSSGA